MSLQLPQLRVAEPCPVAWDSMRGGHRSRFCDQCRLYVHNVSAMTREEVDSLLSSSAGRVCLNGFTRPDGELVTQEALADLLAGRGASPERVAAVRAAIAAGLVATATSLAACDPIQRTGGSAALDDPCWRAPPAQSDPAIIRTGGIVYLPQAEKHISAQPVPAPPPDDGVRYPTTPR